MNKKFSATFLALTLITQTTFALSAPTVTVDADSTVVITGTADSNEYLSVVIEKLGKRYFLKNVLTDTDGNYEVSTVLPANIVAQVQVSNKSGEIAKTEVNTTIDTTTPDVEEPEQANESVLLMVDKHTIDEGYVIPGEIVKINYGDTAWSVLQRTLDKYDIDYDYSYSNKYNSIYLEAIDGDGEFDHGTGSGWMYSINGDYLQYGANNAEVYDGDEVIWSYTTNYGEDLGRDVDNDYFDNNNEDDYEDDHLKIPNQEEVFIEVPMNTEEVAIIELNSDLLGELEELLIEIPDEVQKVTLDLNNFDDELPEIKVNRNDITLHIPKGSEITSDEKQFDLFTPNNKNNEFMYDIIDSDEPIVFDKEIKITIPNMSGYDVAWTLDGNQYPIKDKVLETLKLLPITIGSALQINDIRDIRNKDSYFIKDNDNLIITTDYLMDFIIYQSKDMFKDQKDISDWAIEEVDKAAKLGIISGYEDGTFKPQAYITRAEYISILVRALYNGMVASTSAPFNDVKTTDWFKNAVDVAYESGIISGYGGKFNPNDIINREEMAVILNNALNLQYKPVPIGIMDINLTSDWARDDVILAFAHNLIGGVTDKFNPKGAVTREVAAVSLLRAYEYKFENQHMTRSMPPLQIGMSGASSLGLSIVLAQDIATAPVINKEALDILNETAKYLIQNVEEPYFGSVGGEWTVFGLARGTTKVPSSYFNNYYKHIVDIAKEEHKDTKRGWSTKVTETQRLAIAVAAIGKDPTNVGGVNLIDYSFNKGKNMPYLSDEHQELGGRQGLNELVFGLIAMDLLKTPEPLNVQSSRDEIINTIVVEYQKEDGGFSLNKNGKNGEVDITSMTLTALAPYVNTNETVKLAVNKGIDFLANRINITTDQIDTLTGMPSSVTSSCEGISQTIVALCSLDIDPNTDERFVQNGLSLIDMLLEYYVKGGGFVHVKGDDLNQMATEQAHYALVAYERLIYDKAPIYDMTDLIENENK
ncbi:hypothetical protein AN641_04060 [Candidatus Epulonipiscioides gigas]|nr:hypothetical protein AN641_04060 [Epulopiscium sp. SCG-C07WGA-EpuloA2]